MFKDIIDLVEDIRDLFFLFQDINIDINIDYFKRVSNSFKYSLFN